MLSDGLLVKVTIPFHARSGVMRLRIASSHAEPADYSFDVPPLVAGKQIVVCLPRPFPVTETLSVTHAWLGDEAMEPMPKVVLSDPKKGTANNDVLIFHARAAAPVRVETRISLRDGLPRDGELLTRLSEGLSHIAGATRERVASLVPIAPGQKAR